VSGASYAHPEWLTLVYSIVGVAAFCLAIVYIDRRSRMRRLLGHSRVCFMGDIALVLALAAIAEGLAGPRMGTRSVVVSSAGVDVVFLFDVSRSMDSGDVAPSRLARARLAAEEVLSALPAPDRVALAAYAGRGVLLTPLTPDKAALIEMLPALDSELIHPGGSNLPEGALAALSAFEAASARPRVVFLLADGESSASDFEGAVAALQRAETRLVAGLIGSEAGGTIPDHGSALRDELGEVVRTRRHVTRVRELADSTRGRVFEGDDWGSFDDAELVSAIRAEAGRAPGELIEREVATAAVLPFAGVAFALLSLEALRSGRRREKRGAKRETSAGASEARAAGPVRHRATAAVAGLVAALLLSTPAPLRGDVSVDRLAPTVDPGALLLEGLAHHEAERWPQARRAFAAAAVLARDPKVAAVAYHDLGVVALAQRDYAAARGAFFDSLALAPGRIETRYNLEWTLLAIERDERAPPESSLLDDPTSPTPPSDEPESESEEDARPRPAPEFEAGEGKSEDEPSTAPTERPPESTSGAPSSQSASAHEPISAEQRAQWLDRIKDDPAAALRSAAAAESKDAKRPIGGRARW